MFEVSRSWGSSVRILTSLLVGIPYPAGTGMFLFSTAPRIQLVPVILFPGLREQGREAGRSPSGAETKNVWRYTSTPSCVLWSPV
jgi:hypothetical protein